ncbi:CYTH domain-containing protein [Rhizobium hidalgonense]|uniref:CYTH domain-containing protein n=1 Tax=Rhizobium hidalgonense TaxID=1538159 RepID=UPI000FEC6F39|nr:CYTH domain-containing protein [Rhizobium hidalgonense]QKK22566.1 CYTH domain-containing protein [Rhizobium hidalgonense]RWX17777.1 CYTH domain-containing protein [Rhizobium hidalgonense]
MKTVEIERKFLVRSDAWRASATSVHVLRQGYLARGTASSLRIRLIDDLTAQLAVKFGKRGLTREEFEYDIPLAEAKEMLLHVRGKVLEKTRYQVVHRGDVWEIDVFGGAYQGLTIAEIEMASEKASPSLPSWLGREVTGDKRYSNRALAFHRPAMSPPYGLSGMPESTAPRMNQI